MLYKNENLVHKTSGYKVEMRLNFPWGKEIFQQKRLISKDQKLTMESFSSKRKYFEPITWQEEFGISVVPQLIPCFSYFKWMEEKLDHFEATYFTG